MQAGSLDESANQKGDRDLNFEQEPENVILLE